MCTDKPCVGRGIYFFRSFPTPFYHARKPDRSWHFMYLVHKSWVYFYLDFEVWDWEIINVCKNINVHAQYIAYIEYVIQNFSVQPSSYFDWVKVLFFIIHSHTYLTSIMR